jgi:predicted O-linked N-acetylglucosamine transferase (SPINDLY family)
MQASDPGSILARATAAHQAGNLGEAEKLYQAALQHSAGNIEVLYRLSVLNAQRGRLDAALQLAERALSGNTGIAQLHFHRAELLAALRRSEAAVDAYRKALDLNPNHLEALNNLADTLIAMERIDEAEPLLEKALAVNAAYVPALNNRANLRKLKGRSAEALRDFDRAVALSDGDPSVLFNRSGVLLSMRRHAQAEADCRRILARAPQHIGALFNLCKAQSGQGRLQDALATSDTLIGLQPGNPMAWCDRGSLLAALQRHQEAWACFDKALKIEPNLSDAWFASGMLYSALLQHDAALKCFRRVYALKPNDAGASCRLGETLRRMGRVDEALAAFQDTLRIDPEHPFVRGQVAWLKLHRCNWHDVDSDLAAVVRAVREGRPSALALDAVALSDSAEVQLRSARAHVAQAHPPPRTSLWNGERYRNPRVKVAYLSADFRDHPVSYLIAGLLEQHDRSRFEVFGFSLEDQGDSALGARVAAAMEQFAVVKGKSDEEIARLLRGQQIDIAVDLMGHTAQARTGAFALRPCPVQVNYLGYPGTLGTDFHDYIVADAYVIPRGMEHLYSEKVVRLPHTFQCNDSKRGVVTNVPGRAQAGLPEEGTVYCCFNASAKFTPTVFDLWMRILREVPRSLLWLPAAHPVLQANLRKETQARGIDVQRLVFAPHVKGYADHIARLSLADVFLDTLPYNAHTTASDALWAGVPVVTRPGEALAARVAGSLLHAIGMPELITATPEEYVALAVRLGSEAQFLAATKAKLAANRATQPLFDTDRFRRHIEAAYVAMWERVQRGEPPDHLTIAPIG